MISTFYTGRATSGRGLRDIDDRTSTNTLNNTLSISHSPRPQVAEPIWNAEIMESLLAMVKNTIKWYHQS